MSVGDPTADLDAIGANCQHPYCRQLDFLPFRCESCGGKFCGDHRTEASHDCPKKGAWARERRQRQSTPTPTSGLTGAGEPNILTHEGQCTHPSCKALINTPLTPGIHCTECGRDYCLKHRLGEDHDCKNVPRIVPGSGKGRDTQGIANALGKLRAWGAAKKPQPSSFSSTSTPTNGKPAAKAIAPLSRSSTASSAKSSSQAALHRIISPFTASRSSSSSKPPSAALQLTQLNLLKRTAKGDPKTPPEKRIYLHLEAVSEGREGSAGAKIPRADAFYSSDWSVGKVLDAAAKTLEVRNVNNRGGGEEEKLRVFWVDEGRLLGFAERLGSCGGGGRGVKNGDTLVLLRGVGAPDA